MKEFELQVKPTDDEFKSCSLTKTEQIHILETVLRNTLEFKVYIQNVCQFKFIVKWRISEIFGKLKT